MRISDWSSDVCSSDFSVIVCSSKSRIFQSLFTEGPVAREGAGEQFFNSCRGDFAGVAVGILGRKPRSLGDAIEGHAEGLERLRGPQFRSEEHTSELQSLMRISYAVFCLKKKRKHMTSRHT